MPARLQDAVEVVLVDRPVAVGAHVAARTDGVPGLHGRDGSAVLDLGCGSCPGPAPALAGPGATPTLDGTTTLRFEGERRLEPATSRTTPDPGGLSERPPRPVS